MATIVRCPSKNGQTSCRAQVRRKGAPPLSATFTKLSDAKKWVQITEAAILEGRHFTNAEAKRHTLTDLVERYLVEVMPRSAPAPATPRRAISTGGGHSLGHMRLQLLPQPLSPRREGWRSE